MWHVAMLARGSGALGLDAKTYCTHHCCELQLMLRFALRNLSTQLRWKRCTVEGQHLRSAARHGPRTQSIACTSVRFASSENWHDCANRAFVPTCRRARTFAAEAGHLTAAGEVVVLLELEVVRDGGRQHGLREAVVELETRLAVLQAACTRTRCSLACCLAALDQMQA